MRADALFVVGRPLANPRSGMQVRMDLVLRVLAQLYEGRLTVVAPRGTAEYYQTAGVQARWREFDVPAKSARTRIQGLVSRTLRGGAAHLGDRQFGAFVLEAGRAFPQVKMALKDALVAIGGKPLDVIVSRIDHAFLIDLRGGEQRWVMDTNDLMHRLFNVYGTWQLALGGWRKRALVSRTMAWETSELRKYDRVVAISRYDFEWLRARGLDNAVLEEQCVVESAEQERIVPRFDVGFLGADHAGSLAAARNLIRGAGRSDKKHLRVAIGGGVCSLLNEAEVSPNVSLLGRVPSATAFWKSCRFAVLVSDGETGTSVKFQEALLAETAVLANPEAARWTVAVPGRDFEVVETVESALDRVASGTPGVSASAALHAAAAFDSVRERWRAHLSD